MTSLSVPALRCAADDEVNSRQLPVALVKIKELKLCYCLGVFVIKRGDRCSQRWPRHFLHFLLPFFLFLLPFLLLPFLISLLIFVFRLFQPILRT